MISSERKLVCDPDVLNFFSFKDGEEADVLSSMSIGPFTSGGRDSGLWGFYPLPTIFPYRGGGLIISKRDLSLHGLTDKEMVAAHWVPNSKLSKRMEDIIENWQQRLNGVIQSDVNFDPEVAASLILSGTELSNVQ